MKENNRPVRREQVLIAAAGLLLFTLTAAAQISEVNPSTTVMLGSASVISTYAGNGGQASSGDGELATSAQLQPWSLATDNTGDLYIADLTNNKVRKVNPYGIITTVAGNGAKGYNGDNILATNAEIEPIALAVDASGNIYIADQTYRIRKVSASNGMITTIAGTGTQGYNGDNIPATSAELGGLGAVAVDSSGNVYIDDFGNERIRKVGANGVITTIAGTGTAGYNGDGLQATSAELYLPGGLAIDSNGNIYICDSANHRIRKIVASGIISTVAGTGVSGYNGDGIQATSAEVAEPSGVAVDRSGNIYFADFGNARIRMINGTGVISTVAGNGISGYSGDGGSPTSAEITQPADVKLDASGNFYVADLANYRVREITSENSVNFPPTVVGQKSTPISVSIVTTAPQAIYYGIVTPFFQSPQDYAISSSSPACDPGTSTIYPTGTVCILSIVFQPVALGLRSGSTTIATAGGAGGSGPIPLTGTGVQASGAAVTSSTSSTTSTTRVILTATISGSAPAPTGTVTFFATSDGTTQMLGFSSLQASGTATLATLLPAGYDSITASYSGDSSHLPSTSQGLYVSVTEPNPCHNGYCPD